MNKVSDPAEALLELQNRASPNHFLSPQTILLLAVIFLLGAILFLWAAYIRKPRRRATANKVIENSTLKISDRSRRRRRSKRRNPTLADTGGLPPRKHDGVIPNSH